ncbi:MAG: manganese-dependent inorganic pyrophosphatase [Coriobacteriales bacterium]|jgi:manganese-dependent inorganic pyrophosphatase
MSKVFVVGHKNPDNDAIMSAVIFSQLANAVDKDNEYVACRQGGLPGETAKVLADCGFPEPQLLTAIEPADPKTKVWLTDHAELSQTLDGIENAEIVGIVDHHRIADVTTPQPATYIALPWGSSCTVIARLFEIEGIEPSKEQATCLLAAMMTDTVMLKSPTTTDVDRRIAAKLGEQLGVDPVEFGAQVFRSRGADDFTPEQMVSRDIKRFDIAGKAVYIGQYETVNKASVLEQSDALLKAMEDYRLAHEGDTLVLLVTDIIDEGSQVFIVGDPDLAERGLGIKATPEGTWMPGVLSRKKQVAAPIIAAGE